MNHEETLVYIVQNLHEIKVNITNENIFEAGFNLGSLSRRLKDEISNIQNDREIEGLEEPYNIYETLYEKSEQKVYQLNKKVFELESLLKRLMEDSTQTQSPEQENN